MRHALLLLALALNAGLLGVRCLQERHVAEAARPRGPVFTQAHADILAHFALGVMPTSAQCDFEEPGANCETPILIISGCSVQIAPEFGLPRSLFVGSSALLNPFDELPPSGVWAEGNMRASGFFSPGE